MNRSAQSRRIPPWAATVLLALVAIVPNLNGLGSFFVGDDFDFLAKMPLLAGATDAVTMNYWGEWEPLWYLGFYRDWKLWGMAPFGYHVASLVWLVVAVVGLYRLTERLLPDAPLAPWAAALWFAGHPLHDEAVTYLAARGHPMSAALMVLSLWAWVEYRQTSSRGPRKVATLLTALVAALCATLAKETAVMLPVWVVAIELCVLRSRQPRARVLRGAAGAGLLFSFPVALYAGLRAATIGLRSPKLRGPGDAPWDLLADAFSQLPSYALAGGVPVPFAFMDLSTVESLKLLGWLVAVVLGAPAVYWLLSARKKRGPWSVYAAGLVVGASGLFPVLWAGLGVRRRYFYVPSVGFALCAAVLLHLLWLRRRRTAWALVVALSVAGSSGLVYRNHLYRKSGEVTQAFLEAVGGAAPERWADRTLREERRVALITLPRFMGGDEFSGAYLLHRSDARSAIALAGVDLERFSYALETHYAGDYRAQVEFETREVLDLWVSFRTKKAYEAARGRLPSDDRQGNLILAVPGEQDDEGRRLHYKLLLKPDFLTQEGDELYLYDDGAFRRLKPPAETP